MRHVRWALFIGLAALFATSPATAAQVMAPSTQTVTTGGITYHNGPVMSGRVNVYVVWYGSFPSWSSTQSLVDYFIANWGASHSYATVRNYTDSSGARVAPELALAGEFVDNPPSIGTNLTDSDVATYFSNAINKPSPTFPFDPNGIYLFIFGQHISFQGFCADCAYHGSKTVYGHSPDIKVAVIGAGNCSDCGVPSSPNGNPYADATVNAISHEIAETVTDPYDNAWGTNQNEIGDKCNFNFSEQHPTPNGGSATARVGANYYMIQKLWSPTNGGGCYSGYSPPAAIVWQQGAGGAVGAWKMQDANTVAAYLNYNVAAGQNVIAVGDFSNGIDPQVLTIGSGNLGPVTMTTLHGDGTSSSAAVSGAFAQWNAMDNKIVATSDFNGDGFGDILATNPRTGDTSLYFMQGATVLNAQYIGSYLPWLPQGAADFNGDGLADILWVDNPDWLYGFWMTSASAGSASVGFTVWPLANISYPMSILGAADINGDSRAEVLYYPRSDGKMFADQFVLWTNPMDLWVEEGATGNLPYYPGPYTPPFAGFVDVNRDGTADMYYQGKVGLRFDVMEDWKVGLYGFFWGTVSAPSFGDSGGWTVVGTGGFKEN